MYRSVRELSCSEIQRPKFRSSKAFMHIFCYINNMLLVIIMCVGDSGPRVASLL